MAIVPIKPSSGRDYRLDFPTRSPRGGCLVMPSMARLVPDDELKKTVGTTSVQLTLPHGGVAAGREERFAYQVTDAQTSQPVRDIEPYLGPGGTHSS